MTLSTNGVYVNVRQQSKVINKKETNFRYCSHLFAQFASRSSVNSTKQTGHLFSPQSSLVIVYGNGMYGILASAYNDSNIATQHP